MKQIQEWLGHATFATTADIYSHLDYSSKLESAKKVMEVFDFYGGTKNDDKKILDLLEEHGLNDYDLLKIFFKSRNSHNRSKKNQAKYYQ